MERYVEITREKVLAGRVFNCPEEMQAAWQAWLPARRAQIHRTHGEVIGVRAERDRAGLLPIPGRPYVVCDRHLRVVGKDALVSFEASWPVASFRAEIYCRPDLDSGAVESVVLGRFPECSMSERSSGKHAGSKAVSNRHAGADQ